MVRRKFEQKENVVLVERELLLLLLLLKHTEITNSAKKEICNISVVMIGDLRSGCA